MRKSTVTLCVVSAAAVAASFWLWQQWQHERSLSATLQGRLDASHCPDAPVATAGAGHEVVVPPVRSVPRASNNSQGESSAPPFFAGGPAGFQQRLLKNPDFRKVFRVQQRLEIEQAYRDLPRALGLGPEQANQLFDLMSEQGVKILEVQWQKAVDGKSRQSAYEKLRNQNEAELAELLGPSNMIRLNEYQSSMASRSEVDSVRNELARGAEPMRMDQVDPMVALVSAEMQRMNQELRDAGSAFSDNVDPAIEARRTQIVVATNQRILDGSRSILTSAQSAGLEQLYLRQRLQMESQNELSRLQREAAQNGTPD